MKEKNWHCKCSCSVWVTLNFEWILKCDSFSKSAFYSHAHKTISQYKCYWISSHFPSIMRSMCTLKSTYHFDQYSFLWCAWFFAGSFEMFCFIVHTNNKRHFRLFLWISNLLFWYSKHPCICSMFCAFQCLYETFAFCNHSRHTNRFFSLSWFFCLFATRSFKSVALCN